SIPFSSFSLRACAVRIRFADRLRLATDPPLDRGSCGSVPFPSPGSSFPVRSLRVLHSTEFLSRFVSIPDDFSAFLPEAERRGFLTVKKQAHLLIRQPRSHDSAHRLVRDLEPREDSELLLGASGLSAQMQPFVVKRMG